ncbi:L,D-transpeptidase catalytic domain [Paenimyroides aquimaris]|uniref:L,D-transpeptidase catalytic domain n=1 Tax=Paenimyroides marinum TaxID=1159016 RepID=A0A1H6K7J1_9FLAO|nr:L,D-transpeptidase family protein [Paenimyroides aquimaris]SEH71202.1 L,D-transpeptidase catalytic domain [Paenimyroides aquimaris]
MNWKKIVVGLLLFSACSEPETVRVSLSNAEKKFLIEKPLLFGKNEQITTFYANNDFETVWQDSLNRNELISAIIDSRYDGVLPESYPLAKLIKAHWDYKNLSIPELKKADIDFSENFFKIANQLASGKVNPKKLYGDWEPYIQEFDFVSLLEKSLVEKNIHKTLEDIKPKSELYLKYKKAFAKYVPIISKDTLSAEGLMQKKIWVNFERTKWLQPDLGENYVWINLPEYRLQLVQNNQIVETHKVIVGKKERRTPVLSSSFSGIIINPKWTVPPTILKKDLVPKATANRGYFESNRLTIYDKKTGKQVDPENWNPENYGSYRYVQQTGRLNSLGQIKFDFPNKHMVYLHDTNNRAMFGVANRALSSGCVRVENPFGLAETIFKLEGKNILRSEMDTLAHYEKTKNFKLNQKVNVHQVYFTAVIDSTGSVKILNDIYALDNRLYKRLIQ